MNPHLLFGPDEGWSLAPVALWLLGDAQKLRDPVALIGALAGQLDAAGARIGRLAFISRTLHPQFAGWSVRWSRTDGARHDSFPHSSAATPTFTDSPVFYVQQHRTAFRQRVARQAESGEYSLFTELRAAGLSDYLALPVHYGTTLVSIFTAASDAAEGFSEADIERLTVLARLLAPLIEIIGTRATALGLLNTFVGPRIGERILHGQVKRGDGDRIDAAFWYSDLRGFTHLSETLDTVELLSLLNDYFEHCAAAATTRGGEILQFIGDAILIVFEIKSPSQRADVCNGALTAAVSAFSAIADINAQRRAAGRAVIEFGLGLHVCTVTHANVGSPDRLAFNVVGPAVNMTARIQSKTKELNSPLLVSSDFARELATSLRSLGHHDLRGVAGEQELFTSLPA